MSKAKEINWELIRQAYECTDMTLKEVSEEHNVNLSSIKNKKARDTKKGDPWKKVKKVSNKSRKVARSQKSQAEISTSSPEEAPKKSTGYRSNPKNQFTKRNTAALKHGMYAKHIPDEVLSIMQSLDEMLPTDMLWQQILMQHASIIRAQQIMFVESKNDTTREVKKVRDATDKSGGEIEYELQFAWDKHAEFMKAQTRAIGELRALISKFVAIADEKDERRLKLEIMGLQSTKLQKELSPDTGTEEKLADYFTALRGAFQSAAPAEIAENT